MIIPPSSLSVLGNCGGLWLVLDFWGKSIWHYWKFSVTVVINTSSYFVWKKFGGRDAKIFLALYSKGERYIFKGTQIIHALGYKFPPSRAPAISKKDSIGTCTGSGGALSYVSPVGMVAWPAYPSPVAWTDI